MKRQVYNVYHWSEDIPIVTTTDLDIKKELDIICLEFDGHPWEWDKFSEPGRSHESLFHVRAAVVANFVGHGFYTYKETFMMVPENMEDKELIERFNGVYSNKPQLNLSISSLSSIFSGTIIKVSL